MTEFEGRDFAIFGNGSSLRKVELGDIGSDSVIVRINNFFFEEVLYAGPRVDIAYVGGDRWFFPLYLKTLKTVMKHNDYDIDYVAARQKKILKTLGKEFPNKAIGFRYRNTDVERAIVKLREKHGRGPSAGIQALILAHALGARSVTLYGFDFHLDNSYAYGVNPSASIAAGGSLISNYRLSHNEQLDMDIVRWFQQHGGVAIYRHSSCDKLDFVSPQGPVKNPVAGPRTKSFLVDDWVGSDAFDIRMRSFARRVDRHIRKVLRPF